MTEPKQEWKPLSQADIAFFRRCWQTATTWACQECGTESSDIDRLLVDRAGWRALVEKLLDAYNNPMSGPFPLAVDEARRRLKESECHPYPGEILAELGDFYGSGDE